MYGSCFVKPWPHHIQTFIIPTENYCPPHLSSKNKLPLHSWRPFVHKNPHWVHFTFSLSLSLNFARTGHQELCKGCPEKRKNNKRWVLYITSLSVWSITLVSPELSKVWGSQAQEVARNRLPQGLRVQLSTDWGWGERHWKFYDSWPVILRT